MARLLLERVKRYMLQCVHGTFFPISPDRNGIQHGHTCTTSGGSCVGKVL